MATVSSLQVTWRKVTELYSQQSMGKDDDDSHFSADSQSSIDWPGFVYLGGSASSQASSKGNGVGSGLGSSVMRPLSAAQVGDRLRLVELDCGETNQRLMGMGLVPGALLEVISQMTTGSVIVAIQNQRLGLSPDLAQGLQVIPAEQEFGHFADHSRRQRRFRDRGSNASDFQADSTVVTLRTAGVGSRWQVIGYEGTTRDYKRKLLAMGLTPGTMLKVVRHAPLGDPTEIEVRGFRLSLRKDEADALQIQLLP